jgi:hypothetical protein
MIAVWSWFKLDSLEGESRVNLGAQEKDICTRGTFWLDVTRIRWIVLYAACTLSSMDDPRPCLYIMFQIYCGHSMRCSVF